MKKISKDAMKLLFYNPYAGALAKTIIFFGTVHLIVLTSLAIGGDMDALNAFHIVSLDSIIPNLGHGIFNFVLSWCIVLAEYLLMYLILTKPARQNIQRLPGILFQRLQNILH